MSKLYTEEQVRKVWNTAYVDALALDNKYYKPIFYDDFIASLTPIELPTDEDIYNESPYNITDTYDLGYHNGWMIGAKWVVNKIKGGGDE